MSSEERMFGCGTALYCPQFPVEFSRTVHNFQKSALGIFFSLLSSIIIPYKVTLQLHKVACVK